MSEPRSVAIIVGSLRAASISRKAAHALMAQAPPSLACRIVEIGDLPLYNEDLDGDPPASWTRFRNAMRESDAVLFVTPEYNRSMPACLKNAIDVGSRPPGKSVFDGMPAGVVSQKRSLSWQIRSTSPCWSAACVPTASAAASPML